MDNEVYLNREYSKYVSGAAIESPLRLYQCDVAAEWVDYNGHMSESFYLFAFGDASDALFRFVGIDEAYRASGFSFYTVESHINYFLEASEGEPLSFATQLLGLDQKRLHFFHSMYHTESGDLLATTEQMLLHVDMNQAKAAPIKTTVFDALSDIANSHKSMDIPKQVGRVMAVKYK